MGGLKTLSDVYDLKHMYPYIFYFTILNYSFLTDLWSRIKNAPNLKSWNVIEICLYIHVPGYYEFRNNPIKVQINHHLLSSILKILSMLQYPGLLQNTMRRRKSLTERLRPSCIKRVNLFNMPCNFQRLNFLESGDRQYLWILHFYKIACFPPPSNNY